MELTVDRSCSCFEYPNFSNELVEKVLFFIPSKQLLPLRLICRRWDYIIQDSPLWRPLYCYLLESPTSLQDLLKIHPPQLVKDLRETAGIFPSKVISMCQEYPETKDFVDFYIKDNLLITLCTYGDFNTFGLFIWSLKPPLSTPIAMELGYQELNLENIINSVFKVNTKGYVRKYEEKESIFLEARLKGCVPLLLSIGQNEHFELGEDALIYDEKSENKSLIQIYQFTSGKSHSIQNESNVWCLSQTTSLILTHVPSEKKIKAYGLAENCQPELEFNAETLNELQAFPGYIIGKGINTLYAWLFNGCTKILNSPIEIPHSEDALNLFVEGSCLTVCGTHEVTLYSLTTGHCILKFCPLELPNFKQIEINQHFLFILSSAGFLNIYCLRSGESTLKNPLETFPRRFDKFQFIDGSHLYGLHEGKIYQYKKEGPDFTPGRMINAPLPCVFELNVF